MSTARFVRPERSAAAADASVRSITATCALTMAAVVACGWISHNGSAWAQDNAESAAQNAAEPTTPSPAFQDRDADKDGSLSLEEFVAGKGRPDEVLRRDFKVVDFNGDGKLTYEEFRNVPYLTPRAQRANLPDPLADIVEQRLRQFDEEWAGWDANGDTALSADEFAASTLTSLVPGLEGLDFQAWDRDGNSSLTRDDARFLLEIAYGIRAPTGDHLRKPAGEVIDSRLFHVLDSNEDFFVEKADYLRSGSSRAEKDPEAWFDEIDQNDDGRWSFSEWAQRPRSWGDSLSRFLSLDANLDGTIQQNEFDTAKLPSGQKALVNGLVRAFDADGDGGLSLAEYRATPMDHLIVVWYSARDENDDGTLSPAEFRFAQPPYAAGLSQEMFTRLDINHDGHLELDEWSFTTRHPKALFLTRDTDNDRHLSQQEFLAIGRRPDDVLRRDFQVCDFDGDGKLSYDEYLNVPYLVPRDKRGRLPDPVTDFVDRHMQNVDQQWNDWDSDGDGELSPDEFTAVSFNRHIPGLELTAFADWQRAGRGAVTREGVRRVLEIAYGVRRPEGDLLRTPSGDVLDWRTFQSIDRDGDGYIAKQDFLKSGARGKDPEGRFRSIDTDEDGRLSFAEWADVPSFWAPALERFLTLDTNLDGRIDRSEMLAAKLPGGQLPMTPRMLPAFDQDGDGTLSLLEYRLTPLANLLANWPSVDDKDHDGLLSQGELRFQEGMPLAALTAEYFRLLDINDDGRLDLDEWPYRVNQAKAPARIVFKLRDADGDGKLSFEEAAGGLRRPQPGQTFDVKHEARIARLEEAFRRADADGDGFLTPGEFDSDDGREIIAPGKSSAADKIAKRGRSAGKTLGIKEDDTRFYMIAGFNGLLLVSVTLYLLLKGKKA